MYVNPTDLQIYLQNKSEQPNSANNSIAYGQALKFKKNCYNSSDLHNNCKQLLKTLTKRAYNKTDSVPQINRAISTPKNELQNKIKASNTKRLLLTVTYNRNLPDRKTIIDKNWHMLETEAILIEIFADPSILALKRNKTLEA